MSMVHALARLALCPELPTEHRETIVLALGHAVQRQRGDVAGPARRALLEALRRFEDVEEAAQTARFAQIAHRKISSDANRALDEACRALLASEQK